MASLKRDHHTVSKFYLAGFADGSKQIRRTPLANPEAADIVSISQASVVRDFYLVPTGDGTLSDGVENVFMEIESEAARGFRALVRDREFPIRLMTRGRVAPWIALQHLRGTEARSVLGEAADIHIKTQIALGGREGMRDALNRTQATMATEAEVDAAWAKYSDMDTFGVQSGSVEHIQYIRDQIRVLTHELFMRPWMVVDFDSAALSTCDHPVVWVLADDESDSVGGEEKIVGGLLIPLSRRVGLRIGENQRQGPEGRLGVITDARITGTEEFAQAFNNSVIDNAWEVVFTHPNDTHLTQGPLPPSRRRRVVYSDYKQWQRNEEQSR